MKGIILANLFVLVIVVMGNPETDSAENIEETETNSDQPDQSDQPEAETPETNLNLKDTKNEAKIFFNDAESRLSRPNETGQSGDVSLEMVACPSTVDEHMYT
ncbi:hypothetical protein PHET_00919 [Paragonimus heterotremus]|uniref:Secreted protein n=1 Tax=Paragonimus heterotremus TaxID=100268 RepID=A0A8J4TS51_9TREM|nr:hypothetical protein PHET_00919 [Paragonimus heterotremus]